MRRHVPIAGSVFFTPPKGDSRLVGSDSSPASSTFTRFVAPMQISSRQGFTTTSVGPLVPAGPDIDWIKMFDRRRVLTSVLLRSSNGLRDFLRHFRKRFRDNVAYDAAVQAVAAFDAHVRSLRRSASMTWSAPVAADDACRLAVVVEARLSDLMGLQDRLSRFERQRFDKQRAAWGRVVVTCQRRSVLASLGAEF